MLSCMHTHEPLVKLSLCLVRVRIQYDLPIGKSGRSDRHPDPVLDGTMLHRDTSKIYEEEPYVFPEDLPSAKVESGQMTAAHCIVRVLARHGDIAFGHFSRQYDLGKTYCRAPAARPGSCVPVSPTMAVDESAEQDTGRKMVGLGNLSVRFYQYRSDSPDSTQHKGATLRRADVVRWRRLHLDFQHTVPQPFRHD